MRKMLDTKLQDKVPVSEMRKKRKKHVDKIHTITAVVKMGRTRRQTLHH